MDELIVIGQSIAFGIIGAVIGVKINKLCEGNNKTAPVIGALSAMVINALFIIIEKSC